MSDHRRRIRRQIRRKIGPPPTPSPTTHQGKILSGLNALSTLAEKVPLYMKQVVHYGPASFADDEWASVVTWYRDKGYNTYQQLTLFGVWAVGEDDDLQLLLATKSLRYSAPVYNAESYHALIPRGFRTHYGDDGSPPSADTIIAEWAYDPARRLALRREIAESIETWLRSQS